jgi:glycine hydroxymethyltransferase
MDKVLKLIKKEEKRQSKTLMLIASENISWPEVKVAVGSCLSQKYAEGYPGARYYQGMKNIDEIESIAISRARKLFKVPHANVQPYSGSVANGAVYFAILNPGDTMMGLSLADGGHLSHGKPKITFSGKYFNCLQFGVDLSKKDWFDFEKIAKLAKKAKPKLIIVGTTAFPREINWQKFAKIADSVGAYLVADISHVVGLVAGGAQKSPVSFVHVVTTTTHKTLRGPRGAIIMVTKKGLKKDIDLPKKIDRAVFPGLQGGPQMNTIAAIAIALKKASEPGFKQYAQQVVANAKTLAEELFQKGFDVVTGGTDNHIVLVNLKNKKINGAVAAEKLEKAGIVVNKNAVIGENDSVKIPWGIRLGTSAVTALGMREKEMKKIAEIIFQVLERNKQGFRKSKNSLWEKFL